MVILLVCANELNWFRLELLVLLDDEKDELANGDDMAERLRAASRLEVAAAAAILLWLF